MKPNDKDYMLFCLLLARMTFLSVNEKFILLKNLDSLHNLVVLSIEDISKLIGRKSRAKWNGDMFLKMAQQDLHIIDKFNICVVLYTDKDYPILLKEIVDSPFLLFYRGNIKILQNSCVSVVGTRKMTVESAKACFDFAKQASLNGTTVVSGLAFGIDRKAHEGALAALENAVNKNAIGKTAAVLPGAIDNIVPVANKKLASRILENGGCILSEYPPKEAPLPYRYVQRNRIIAGLSQATVVIQAPPGSGAMHTADFALGYNRDVMIHKVAFSESSKKISDIVRHQLKMNDNQNAEKRKLRMDPELLVQDGAPVIENYADYTKCLFDALEK